MNKLSKMILGVAVSAMVLSGCKNQDVVAPTVTNPNQYPNGVIQKSITFSVQVIPSSDGSGLRTEGLSGAVVTISQNGSTASKSVGSDGLAVFTGLNEGTVNVYVTGPTSGASYVAYNANTTLAAAGTAITGTTGNNSNQTVTYNQQLTVTLPRLSGNVSGTVYSSVITSGVAAAPAPVSGVKVKIKFSNIYQPNTFFTTTKSDGSFSFPTSLLDGQTGAITIDTVFGGYSYTGNVNVAITGGLSVPANQINLNPTQLTTFASSVIKGELWGFLSILSASGFNTGIVYNGNSSVASGITVTLTNVNNTNLVYSTTSSSSGTFSFNNLPSGTYSIYAATNVPYSYLVNGTISYSTNAVLKNTNGGNNITVNGTSAPGTGTIDLGALQLQ